MRALGLFCPSLPVAIIQALSSKHAGGGIRPDHKSQSSQYVPGPCCHLLHVWALVKSQALKVRSWHLVSWVLCQQELTAATCLG